MGVVCVPHRTGRGFEGRLCGIPSLLTPQSGGALGMSFGCWGLGDWDAGVNRVAGSWTLCVMGLWGPQKRWRALEEENRTAAGPGFGLREVPNTLAHPL